MSYFHNIDNLYVMENESEKSNNQIVLFKTIKYNISDYSHLTYVSIFLILYNKLLKQEKKIRITLINILS